MNPTYLDQLKYWGIRAGAMIVTALALALIQRYVGITIELPPAPPPAPVQVVVQPVPGDPASPKVTVHYPQPQK